MRVRFICGCLSPNITNRENLKTMDSVNVDEAGFLVCGIHHYRRYGYRSIPELGDGSRGKLSDYDYAGFTPLEIEGYVVFGDLLEDRSVKLAKPLDDSRDARDPTSLVEKVRKSKKFPFGVRHNSITTNFGLHS